MKRKIEKELLKWKNDPARKPLLIDGARQVGKTYSLKKFAQEQYDNYVHINFDIDKSVAASMKEDISTGSIIRLLEAKSGQAIVPGSTLVIFDEVQASGRALSSLKYFCEEAPDVHIAAAGSLLGVAINREEYSFPVGKVNTLQMYPFDFEETLEARGEALLLAAIQSAFDKMEPIPEALHSKAMALYREYLITGGMPVCVKARADGQSLLDMIEIQHEIVNNYVADMAKYADASEAVKIRACYNSLPAQLAKENKKFQYKVVRKGGTSALFGASIEWLTQAGVVLKCQNISHGYIPVSAYADLSAFKLYCSDVGLLTMQTQIPQSLILTNADNPFLGLLAENFVAQQLKARGTELYYWTSDGIAELDFVAQSQSGVTAIEVKKSDHTKSKSLSMFRNKYAPARAVRLSSKNFGDTGGVLSVPLYAAGCLAPPAQLQ